MTSTMTGVLVANLIAAVTLSVSLKSMWQMMNICQVVLFLPAIAQMSSSAAYLIDFLETIVYMRFIPTDKILAAVEASIPSTPTTVAAIKSLSDSLTLIAALIGLSCLLVAVMVAIKKYLVKNQRFVKLVNSLEKKLLWNSVLRYTLTAYLNWAILAINNLFALDK